MKMVGLMKITITLLLCYCISVEKKKTFPKLRPLNDPYFIIFSGWHAVFSACFSVYFDLIRAHFVAFHPVVATAFGAECVSSVKIWLLLELILCATRSVAKSNCAKTDNNSMKKQQLQQQQQQWKARQWEMLLV